jgi:hypothetical protein
MPRKKAEGVVTPQMQAIIEDVARDCGVDQSEILKRKVRQNATGQVLFARVQIAKRMHMAGYSTVQIGDALFRDHSTIVYYLNRYKPPPSKRAWRPPSVRHLFCVGCRLCTFRADGPPPPPMPPNPRKRYLIPYAGVDKKERWKERP